MTREARLFLFVLLWVLNGFQFQWPALAQDDARWQSVSDAATGITLELPLAVLTEQKSTKWGTNWSARDKSINVDTLLYPKGPSLKARYNQLRAIKGHFFTKDKFRPDSFILDGTTAEGGTFHVEGRMKGETVKGLSVLYSAKRKTDGPAIVERVAKGFAAFAGDAQSAGSADPFIEKLVAVTTPKLTASSISVAPNIDRVDSDETVVFSPDGRLLASSSGYGADSIKIWDVASGRLLRTLQYYAYFLDAVFTPDSKSLITGHKDGRVKVWNLETGESTTTFLAGSDLGEDVQERMPVQALWIDLDGTLLITGDNGGTVRFWDLGEKKLLKTFTLDIINIIDVGLLADARQLIAVGSRSAKVVDVESGRIVETGDIVALDEKVDGPAFEQWSIVGDRLLAFPSTAKDCSIDTLLVQELPLAGPKKKPVVLDKPEGCLRPDGDYETGRLRVFRAVNGKHIVVARRGTPELRVIEIGTWKTSRTITWPDQSSADVIEVSADLTRAVTNHNGRLRVHQLESGIVSSELAAVGDSDAYAVASDNHIVMQHSSRASGGRSNLRTWQLGSLSSLDSTDSIEPDVKIPVAQAEIERETSDKILDVSADGQQVLLVQQKQNVVVVPVGGGKAPKRFSLRSVTEIRGGRFF